jgi:hypothetical protein
MVKGSTLKVIPLSKYTGMLAIKSFQELHNHASYLLYRLITAMTIKIKFLMCLSIVPRRYIGSTYVKLHAF